MKGGSASARRWSAWRRGRSITPIAYTKERKQFGKPVAEFQAVQHQLARAATEVHAARLMVYEAARAARRAGSRFSRRPRCASCRHRRAAERVASLAVNLFGGYGFVKDYPVEKLYRDAKIGQIYEGTSNLQLADDREADARKLMA